MRDILKYSDGSLSGIHYVVQLNDGMNQNVYLCDCRYCTVVAGK